MNGNKAHRLSVSKRLRGSAHRLCYRLQQEELDVQPRLFECSNKTGRFVVTEVTDFNQDDLEPSDVMLLDTWDQVRSSHQAQEFPLVEVEVVNRTTSGLTPGSPRPSPTQSHTCQW